jgi:L-ascorbate metabolism protein UlaG (beta-lactamase superfamily)
MTLLPALALPSLGAPAPAAESPRAPGGNHAVVMTYVANEGLLIAGAGEKILIDALFIEGWGRFAVPSTRNLARMREAAPPFDRVTALLLTHFDGDHFDPASVIAHLQNDPACVFLGPAQADEQLRAQPGYDAVKARVLAVPRTPAAFERTIQGRPFKAMLLEHSHEDPSRPPSSHNLGHLFSVGGVTFLHAGDTGESDPAVWRRAGLREDPVDVLILPWFFFTELPAASVRRLINDLKPKAIVLVHFPAQASPAALIPPDRTRDLPPVLSLATPMTRLVFDRQGPNLSVTTMEGTREDGP